MVINHNFFLTNKGISNSVDSSGLARHRWYPYKEGFSPELVDSAINSTSDFDKDKDIILDPFNGSGTVTLHSSIKGYKAKGIEVNPFSSYVSSVKQINLNDNEIKQLRKETSNLISAVNIGKESPLLKFSTFSELGNNDKWLFNSEILNAFEGGRSYIQKINNIGLKKILNLAIIKAAMENSNAQKDGKCLRYKKDWESINYSKQSFAKSLQLTIEEYASDLESHKILSQSEITRGDSRNLLNKIDSKFKICVTSPPYLNSFDYTDIYRPELFLGNFVTNAEELRNIRKHTLRSHTNHSNPFNPKISFGLVYDSLIEKFISNQTNLWSTKIPSMIQSYFEDMQKIMHQLRLKADKKAQLWIIVANSAYADMEIPTDLILADIGAKENWYLKEIGVLRYLHKRGSKYSPNITKLRESVIIFSTESN